MTAQNMAKFRLDPNIDFWKNLKDGSDHFEVTKNEPSVLVCGKHYVFDATTKDEVTGSEPCPALKRDPNVEAQVAEKENEDEAKVAELAATGVKPIRLVYADGGQNPAFTGYKDVSDPEALASGPQEIVLNDRAKPVSAAVKVAVADADKKRVASAGASARRGSGGAAGFNHGGHRLYAESAGRDARRSHRRRQERSKVAAPWRSGCCASADRRRGERSRSTGSCVAAAAAPRRRAFGVAAHAADPADATKFRRNSG